eukprot:Nk52_evm113s221 gene=Nk52_evmTU113s221
MRRLKKRDMRRMWISRINIASNEHGVPYSKFMQGLVRANVLLNRKVLANLAINEPKSFQTLAALSKQTLEAGGAGVVSKRAIEKEGGAGLRNALA